MEVKQGNNERNIDIDGRIILKLILNEYDGKILNRLIWLKLETNGELL